MIIWWLVNALLIKFTKELPNISASSSCRSYIKALMGLIVFHLRPFFPIGGHNGHESSISGGMRGERVKKCVCSLVLRVKAGYWH